MSSLESEISSRDLPAAKKLSASFYLGLGLYVFSFFLPAVDQPSPMPGWMCAYLSLWAWFNKQLWLCLFAGIINPLVLAYVVLRFRDRAPRACKILALAVLGCIPVTWLFLSSMELGIRVGHVVWIASLFLMLFPVQTFWPSLRDAGWIAVPPLLILVWAGLRTATTYPLQPPTDRDIFIYQVAMQFKDLDLCQKIPPFAEGNGSGDRPGYQISYLQSDCYFKLANTLHDPSLCDKVKPVSKGMRDGSKYTPESCRSYRGYSGIEVVSPYTVTTWMRQLGYTDPDLYRSNYSQGYNSIIHEAYDRLKNDRQFAKDIAAAPSFDEPLVAVSARPPNDLEYLYGMFAIDAKDASMCRKISPNARKQWFNKQTISLRVECYHDLARNSRDPKFCENVPVAGNHPPTADFDSRDTCVRDVRFALSDPATKSYWSPGLPPTFESVRKALQDIGVDLDLPHPSDSDYEDYLLYLMDRDPAGRAEFLRRVAALK